jgi:hypothetical protein
MVSLYTNLTKDKRIRDLTVRPCCSLGAVIGLVRGQKVTGLDDARTMESNLGARLCTSCGQPTILLPEHAYTWSGAFAKRRIDRLRAVAGRTLMERHRARQSPARRLGHHRRYLTSSR